MVAVVPDRDNIDPAVILTDTYCDEIGLTAKLDLLFTTPQHAFQSLTGNDSYITQLTRRNYTVTTYIMFMLSVCQIILASIPTNYSPIAFMFASFAQTTVNVLLMTYMDRTLLYASMKSFFFIYVFIQIIALQSLLVIYETTLPRDLLHFIPYIFSHISDGVGLFLLLIMNDACPFFPKKSKIIFLAFTLFYWIYRRILLELSSDSISAVEICTYYYECSQAIDIMKNLNSTIVLLFIKYLYASIVHPNKGVFLLCPIEKFIDNNSRIRPWNNEVLEIGSTNTSKTITTTNTTKTITTINNMLEELDYSNMMISIKPEFIQKTYERRPLIYIPWLFIQLQKYKRLHDIILMCLTTTYGVIGTIAPSFQSSLLYYILTITGVIGIVYACILYCDRNATIRLSKSFEFWFVILQVAGWYLCVAMFYRTDRLGYNSYLRTLYIMNLFLGFIVMIIALTLPNTGNLSNNQKIPLMIIALIYWIVQRVTKTSALDFIDTSVCTVYYSCSINAISICTNLNNLIILCLLKALYNLIFYRNLELFTNVRVKISIVRNIKI